IPVGTSAVDGLQIEIPPQPPEFAPPSQYHVRPLAPPAVKPTTSAPDTKTGTAVPGSATTAPPINPWWPYGPHPDRSIADPPPKEGSSPLDGHTIFLAQPSFLGLFDVRIATIKQSTHYIESYDLGRANRSG